MQLTGEGGGWLGGVGTDASGAVGMEDTHWLVMHWRSASFCSRQAQTMDSVLPLQHLLNSAR